MLDTAYKLTRKGIFLINPSKVGQSISLFQMLQGIIYDYIRTEFDCEPDWFRFCGYGQSESEDQRVKVQTAILHDGEGGATLEWALRIKVRDLIQRRRNWMIHISIRMESEEQATLYFAQLYYDHLVGCFSIVKAPVLGPTSLFFMLMQNPRITCKSGTFPLPAGAVPLDDTLIDDFLECVRDSKRQIPVLLITCADLLDPGEVAKQLAGNMIVCWLDDVNILRDINEALAPDVSIKWDSIQVLLPFSQEVNFHPAFLLSDISRMGGNQVVSLLHQAYCENFRADDRRAFVTVDSINQQRDRMAMSALQDRLSLLAAEVARYREQNTRLEAERDQLQKEYDFKVNRDLQAELTTYEVMLGESMAKMDTIKKEIASLTQRLYECMGKDFVAEKSSEACMSELQHSIFICFARLGARKQ